MKMLKLIAMGFVATMFLQSCGMYDLRTMPIKKEGITVENTEKGKLILEKAWKAQGLDNLANFEVYSFHGNDTWKGMLGKMGQIWPEMKQEIDFSYRIGTFDGKVEFKDGIQKGDVAGLQNWNFYEISGDKTEFKDKDLKPNNRKVFGIAAFQYFTEMVDRLRNAPIISYAGEKEMRGQLYDLVFCTWETEKPHDEHDQYLLWINQETGIMDFAQYTIRESYMKPPGYKLLGGAIEYTDYRNIDGVMIPHEQLVYAMNIKKNQEKFLHRMLVSDFKFDGFNLEELKVNKELVDGGDFKN